MPGHTIRTVPGLLQVWSFLPAAKALGTCLPICPPAHSRAPKFPLLSTCSWVLGLPAQLAGPPVCCQQAGGPVAAAELGERNQSG